MVEECFKIPIITFPIKRLHKFLPGFKLEKVYDVIPFAGLDIEGIDAENVRIEYNPNRPDFSSQYGIVRALKGLLEIESGIPKYQSSPSSKYTIKVSERMKQLRPFIVALVATRNKSLTNEDIKELIGMQEDLHNGVGRSRKKASIGIHNLDKIKFPLAYTVAEEGFSFVPLDRHNYYTLKQILHELDSGKEYGFLLEKTESYPIILDSDNTVLSFPPIVNSEATKLSADTKNILVEVTALNKRTAEDMISIIAMSLFEAGFMIHSVAVKDTKTGNEELTPNMKPKTMYIDPGYINQVLGLNLRVLEILLSLKKSRLGASVDRAKKGKLKCLIPRYRTDLSSQIDLVEEAAIGYGIFKLQPSIPSSKTSGAISDLTRLFNAAREILVGMEMLETQSYSLVSKRVQYDLTGVNNSIGKALTVDGTNGSEYEVLRDSLIPLLLQTLSHNIHEEYPQKLFEIGKVFQTSDGLDEHWNVGVVIAHSSANYTEAKSSLQEFFNGCFGPRFVSAFSTPASYKGLFMEGRCANICYKDKNIGIIGEITPECVEKFKLRVPIAAFELNMSFLLELTQS